jgi:hypothetical protein
MNVRPAMRRGISQTGFYGIAAERLDEALHPIKEVVLAFLGGDPGPDKNRRAAFVDPVVEVLNLEAVLDEHRGCGACIVWIAKTKIGLHTLQHV